MENKKEGGGSAGREFRVSFLIVGAQKCGTTALATFLGHHSEICIAPGKETHFFDDGDFDDSLGPEGVAFQYRSRFTNHAGQKIVGEATPSYMYVPGVAERIHKYAADMKLIVLLRDPVERAISHYNMQIARGHETLPLSDALAAEARRLELANGDRALDSSARRHSYRDRGYYHRQIKRMLEVFPMSQMLFIQTEALRSDHAGTLDKVYRFLGVEDTRFIPEPETVFSSTRAVEVSASVRSDLRAQYRDDITALEGLLGWDLAGWKRGQ